MWDDKNVKFDTNINNRNNNIQISNIREAFKSSIIRLRVVSEQFSFVKYFASPFFTKLYLERLRSDCIIPDRIQFQSLLQAKYKSFITFYIESNDLLSG